MTARVNSRIASHPLPCRLSLTCPTGSPAAAPDLSGRFRQSSKTVMLRSPSAR